MSPQEKDLYKFILIIAVVLGIIIAYFIFSIIRQQRRTLSLNQEKILAEITTLENERRRIASDLHDEIGPLLSAVKLQINSVESEDSNDKMLIDKSSSQIDEIISKMREISNNLMPNTLVRKGLVSALEEFTGTLNKTNQLRINFSADPEVKLSKEKEVNIYRMVQEIIHNTIKHAKATELNIRLQTKDNDLILITEDNGIGFNFDTRLKENSGLGLRNLSSRTEIMGGTHHFYSQPGKGTKYVFELPLG
ncbi:MAG: sensor histidine kinase [Bacteroidetes bacterium]|nr:MAG: sensor histidine kinase [Bacteroidota bacterium]